MIGICVLLSSFSLALIMSPSFAEIPSIGVYNDLLGVIPISSLNWGNLHPGSQITKTLCIRNLNPKLTITDVSVQLTNASTYAGPFLSLSGNASKLPLKPFQVSDLPITLKVSDSATPMNFTFDTVVVAYYNDSSSTTLPATSTFSFSQLLLVVAGAVGVFLIIFGRR